LVFNLIPRACFDKLVRLDLSDAACLKMVVGKALGYGIIVAASIIKVPQIIKIAKSKTVEGIAPSMWFVVFLCYSSFCYHFSLDFCVANPIVTPCKCFFRFSLCTMVL
jgi:uncharacterized protein with PQ loop repeat